jgi:DNA-dependent protein kinase catalytic subunit
MFRIHILDYALQLLLQWSDDKINIVRFLAKTLNITKTEKFSECNKKVFELIQTVAKLHAGKVKPYAKDIIDICVGYLKSNQSGAYEKEGAAQTIYDLIFNDAISDAVELDKLIYDVMSVFNQKNLPMRLQKSIYEMLGGLSKTHPENFNLNKAVELRNKMLNTIQSLFKDDKASTSMILISGAVEGLRSHLVNFTPSLQEDPTFSEKLYECMVQLSDPDKYPGSSSNRVAFRNMLQIVHQYGGLNDIPQLLFRDYKIWQTVLSKWISSKAYEDKNAGVHAMQMFHQQIAKVLEQRNSEEDKRILLFFMKYFQDTLKSSESQPHEIRIAVRGFGAMAVACKLLLEPKYLSERFDLVMQRTEYSYNTNDRLLRREVLEHLPFYVESLSQIMNQLDEISGIQMESLETVFVTLIKDFHYLSSAHHSLVATSMLEAFGNLQKLGE